MKRITVIALILLALLFVMLPAYAQNDELDYSALESAIEGAEALDEKDYSVSDWEDISSAIEVARGFLDSESQEDIDLAATTLNELVASRTALDFSQLHTAVASVEGLDETEFTTETWDALVKALENIVAMLESRDQNEIDGAVLSFNEAVEGLKAPDYTVLEEKVEVAEQIENEGYSIESWGALESAMQSASEALTSRSQTAIDAAAEALTSAIEGLKAPDYAALEKAIEEAESLVAIEYTEELWAAILDAVESVKTTLTSMSQVEIDTATESLTSVVSTTPRLDRQALAQAIALANSKAQGDYTTESWEILSRALLIASTKQLSRVQADIDDALKSLEQAINALAMPDYSALEETIAAALTREEASYTTESWMILEAAIKVATNARTSTSQIEIDEARITLDFAISNLEKVESEQDSVVAAGGCSLSLTSSAAVALTVLLLGFGFKKKD